MNNRVRILCITTFLPFGIFAGEYSSLKNLEEKLTPFFQNRTHVNSYGLTKTKEIKPPSTSELWKVAETWGQLSEGFKKIYKASVAIPEDFSVYETPGYGIEVYYTKEGKHAVDTIDMIGYDASGWQKNINKPNGIPDYVDNVAWAMDSAWSMEVERFGFMSPVPYTSATFSSDKFKVTIEDVGSDQYGITFPIIEEDSTESGFSCLLTIRNNWIGWNLNEIIDYETHPEKGIRITCVHEFFHAIQYRMCHKVKSDIFIDSFPVSWLEGTASMMEEVGFPEVNDYVQYSQDYFDEPSHFMIFNNENSVEIYSNSLLCLFLSQKVCPAEDPMKFIRSVLNYNLNKSRSFPMLLSNASKEIGYTWVQLLNQFHTESFFAGSNASSDFFLNDAKKFNDLTYKKGEFNKKKNIEVFVYPWSVRFLSYLNNDKSDSLQFNFQFSDKEIPKDIAASIILHNAKKVKSDSIIIDLSSDEFSAPVKIMGTSEYTEAVVVISNGMYKKNLSMSVSLGEKDSRIVERPVYSRYTTTEKSHCMTVLLNGKVLNTINGNDERNLNSASSKKTSTGVYIFKNLNDIVKNVHLRKGHHEIRY